MLRTLFCAVLGVGIAGGLAFADKEKEKDKEKAKEMRFVGKITKLDADKGTFTVEVKMSSGPANKDFTADKDTKFWAAGREMIKDGLKDARFKVDAEVTVTTDKEGKKVISIRLGGMEKEKEKEKTKETKKEDK